MSNKRVTPRYATCKELFNVHHPLHSTLSRQKSTSSDRMLSVSCSTERLGMLLPQARSVARKETLGVHQKNWVCHIYCQINAQKKQACLLGINMLV